MSQAVLLDTCTIIYLSNGLWIRPEAVARIEAARVSGGVLVSPVSAWEIGLLARPARTRAFQFLPDPRTWFSSFMAAPGVRSAALHWDMALGSSLLPEPLHGDPADRLLIATARQLAVPIVTRDAAILDYATAGHVQAVPC